MPVLGFTVGCLVGLGIGVALGSDAEGSGGSGYAILIGGSLGAIGGGAVGVALTLPKDEEY